MHTLHPKISQLLGMLRKARMSYSRLSMKTGIHLSKLKRIFSGRQMIRIDDYQTMVDIIGGINALLKAFPGVKFCRPKAVVSSHRIDQANEDVRPYDLEPDPALF